MSHIVVVGPGALGILFSVRLSKAGQRVSIFDYRPDRAEYLNKFGLKLLEGQEEVWANPVVFVDPTEIDAPDFVMVLVKAHQTEGVVRELKAICSEQTLVVSLQNGIGAGEILKKAVDEKNIFLGTTTHGANKISWNQARHAGTGPTVLGPLMPQERLSERIDRFVQVLCDAGFETKAVCDIYPHLWKKLLINIAINPLTALTGLKNGMLLEHVQTLRLQEMVLKEAFTVLCASGVDLGMDLDGCMALVKQVCEATGENVSSMLQDRLNCRETEIDFMTGAVLNKAREIGIEAPINEMFTNLIRFNSKTKWQQFRKRLPEYPDNAL